MHTIPGFNARFLIFPRTYLWVGPLLKSSLLSLSLKTLILFSNLCRGSFPFHHLQAEDMLFECKASRTDWLQIQVYSWKHK